VYLFILRDTIYSMDSTTEDTFVARLFDGYGHLIIAVILSWLIGALGFHFLWLMIVFYSLYSIDDRRSSRNWLRRFRQLEVEKKKVEAEVSIVNYLYLCNTVS
jgi:Ca2+-dependent lipid-binding protein